MKPPTVGDVLDLLESKAPSGTAESWDNVGLLAGDRAWKTPGAVVCIDLNEESIEAAQSKGYRLIVNHHPCIFPRSRGMSKIVPDSGKAGLVFQALRKGIAVAACHTNFDRCALEVQNTVASGLGLEIRGRLHESSRESFLKLVVFVPRTHLDAVREAVFAAGAGQIGNYDSCGFHHIGEGTFRGSSQTNPFLGRPGELERAQEARFETILPRGLERPVLKALRSAHPYEEIAYDLYPLEQSPTPNGMVRGLGYGFWGEFPEPKSFPAVLKSVRRLFQLDGFLLTEPAPRQIRRVGYVAGKGEGFADAARAARCDLFITGEAGYHVALESSRQGMTVMELGHRESERFFSPTVQGWLKEMGLASKVLEVPTQRFWSGGMK